MTTAISLSNIITNSISSINNDILLFVNKKSLFSLVSVVVEVDSSPVDEVVNSTECDVSANKGVIGKSIRPKFLQFTIASTRSKQRRSFIVTKKLVIVKLTVMTLRKAIKLLFTKLSLHKLTYAVHQAPPLLRFRLRSRSCIACVLAPPLLRVSKPRPLFDS